MGMQSGRVKSAERITRVRSSRMYEKALLALIDVERLRLSAHTDVHRRVYSLEISCVQ